MCGGQDIGKAGGGGSNSMAPWMDPNYAWGFNTNKDLNAITDSGLTVRQEQALGRKQGYTGAYGGGGFTDWRNQNNNMDQWNSLLSGFAQQDIDPYAPGVQARGDWQRSQRASGYSGDFSDIDPIYGRQQQPASGGTQYQDIPWQQILGGYGGGADYIQGRGALNTSIGLADILAGMGMGGGTGGLYGQSPYTLNGIPWSTFATPGQNVEPSSAYNPWGNASRTSASMQPLIG